VYASLFERDLDRGERVVWTGQPDARRIFTPADVFLVPFSLVWGGFALYWEATVLGWTGSPPAPPAFAVFGLPFVVLGLYFMVGRFFYQGWVKRNTYYALTNRRALILRQLRGRHLDSIPLATIPSLTTTASRDGSGSIVFGPSNLFDSLYGNTGLSFFRRGVYTPAFFDIGDVQAVAAQIEQLQREQPKRKRRRSDA
jgi:hypothetical protein